MASLLDHPLIAQRYFFPRGEAPADPTWVSTNGAELACWSSSPHPDAPTLVHFHGNGEVVADYTHDLAPLFIERGFNVFFAEYRGYGASTGDPTMTAMLDDVDAVFEKVASENIFVYGRSVGSIYALELAHRHPEIQGLIIESGIADPLERILLRVTPEELGVSLDAIDKEARARFDHRAKLAGYDGPVLIMHARGDSLLPVSNAERMAEWAANAELKIFERGDHNSILAYNTEAILKEVAALAGL